MDGIVNFETFLIAGILLNLTPGNDTVFILSRSMSQGKKAGVVSALGIGTGTIVHTLLAAFGLSIVLAKSVVLFNVIKFAGAAYLVYLGVRMIMTRSPMPSNGGTNGESAQYLTIYRDAILTNVLNPKVGLFFIAFLPQFIDPSRPNAVVPFLTLGLTFIVTGTIWCLLLAIFASGIVARFKGNGRMSAYLHRICGIALLGLGVKVALSGRGQ